MKKEKIDRLVELKTVAMKKAADEIASIQAGLVDMRKEAEAIEKELMTKTSKEDELATWVATNGKVIVAQRGVGVSVVGQSDYD